MNKYVLTCGSTTDLDASYLEQRNIYIIPFHYFVAEKEYIDDFGKTLSYKDFYDAMRSGAMTKTRQVNVEEFKEFFKKFLDKGLDVIHVTLSSGLSGTYNSARMAKEELENKYPNQKIVIIDSLGASSGYGMLMDTLADYRDMNYSIDDIVKVAEDIKLHLNHVFFSTDLTFYVRGGRVSKTAGFIGNLFKICPLLDMNDEGKLIPRKKIRGKKHAISEMIDTMEDKANSGRNYHCKCFISHSDCYKDALEVKKLAEARFPCLKDKIKIFNIGTTIGSHSGPGTVAIFFYGKERTR